MTSYLAQQILNGIQLGAIYALIALGYTMVYGIIKLINFAHADIFMVGAYVAFFMAAFYAGSLPSMPFQIWVWVAILIAYLLTGFLNGRVPVLRRLHCRPHLHLQRPSRLRSATTVLATAGVDLALTALIALVLAPLLFVSSRALFRIRMNGFVELGVLILCAMAVCAVAGIALEKIVYRPLRYRPRLSVLISALGASLFLENFSSLDIVFGNGYRAFPGIVPRTRLAHLDSIDLTITSTFAINITVLALLLVALWYLVERTLVGKQMRAVAFDKDAAALMGIDIDRIISITFMVGASLAGVSGVLYAANYGVLQSPFLGFTPGIKAFIAAVIGGVGSLPGAVLGAFLMGVSEVFANSIDSNLGFAAAFVILIVILLVKPTGLLGKKDHEKL